MVSDVLAPKWTLAGIAQRASRLLDEPADISLALRIGWFVLRAPALLRRYELGAFVALLRRARAREFKRYRATHAKIERLRAVWLKLPYLRSRDMCYVRALTLYRFLDVEDERLGVHIGVEYRDDPRERLRGHAWVTFDGSVLEGPDVVRAGRVRELPLVSRVR